MLAQLCKINKTINWTITYANPLVSLAIALSLELMPEHDYRVEKFPRELRSANSRPGPRADKPRP